VFIQRDGVILARFFLGNHCLPPDYVPLEMNRTIPKIDYTITFEPSDVVFYRQALAVEYLGNVDTRFLSSQNVHHDERKRHNSRERQEIKLTPLNDNIREVILGHIPSPTRPIIVVEDASYKVTGLPKFKATSAQTEAINRALTNSVTLVQGPPGCGKTTFIAALVYHILHLPDYENKKILVCGTSNVSVGNLAKVLAPLCNAVGKKVVWLATQRHDVKPGPKSTVEEQALCYQQMLRRQTVQGQRFRQLEEQFWRRNFSARERKEADMLREILEHCICSEADVVCCTLESSFKGCLFDLSFPIVIMDEATQAVEPSALIPLLHNAHKVVLVGDQNQLGPVVPYEFKGFHFKRGLFVRLLKLELEYDMLDEQFRMHPEISAFPNKEFYGGVIRDAISAED
jgi:regulator of nonsense transcripts 1